MKLLTWPLSRLSVRVTVGPERRQPGIAERASYKVEVLHGAL